VNTYFDAIFFSHSHSKPHNYILLVVNTYFDAIFHSARFYTKEDSGCYDPDDDAFLDSTQKGEICLISPGLSKDQFIVMRKAERVLMYVILIEYSNVAEKNSVKIGVDYQ
jgi:hypothetical protein